MRLEAGKCGRWDVFDLGPCEFLNDVRMVDTDQAIVERFVLPYRIEDGCLVTRVQLARKIEVFPSCRLVVIFPWPHTQMETWAS